MSYVPTWASLVGFCFILLIILLKIIMEAWSAILLRRIPQHDFEGSKTHDRYVKEYKNLLLSGYRKFTKKSEVFRMKNVNTGGERIILPMKYFDEIKVYAPTVLNGNEEARAILLYKYTGIPDRVYEANQVVKVDMMKNLSVITEPMEQEVDDAFRKLMPECKEFTPIKIYSIFAYVVARVSSRVLVGPELSRNEEWIRIMIDFSKQGFEAATTLKKNYPSFMFWLVSWNFAPRRSILAIRRKAADILRPTYLERLARRNDPTFVKPVDGIQWLIDSYEEPISLESIVDSQLRLSMTAIHTTVMTITNVMIDLLDHPEYIEDLRKEVDDVLQKERGWNKSTFSKVKKMDSFLKESQRLSPPLLTTVNRKAFKAITLKDGFHVPRGSTVSFANAAVSQDPDIFPNPSMFDGYRFLKLRSRSEKSGDAYQYVSINSKSLHWGAGVQACPGRFFASNEIKLIIAYMLQNYDFRLPEGSKRAKDESAEITVVPKVNTEIELKRKDSMLTSQ